MQEVKIPKEWGNLSLEQQSKLMREIDGLKGIEDEGEAKVKAKGLVKFIFALEAHRFITPDKRCRYHLGIKDAMDSRCKNESKK